MMAAISERLALGWNPLRDAKAPKSSISAFDAYDAFLKVKAREAEAQSLASYKSYVKIFTGWLQEKGFIPANPFDGIKRKPKRLTAKKRRTFTDDELSRLFAWLEDNNREFLAVCLLCYACFIRPKEIALLRCSDIDLDAQTVHVRSEIAKNDNDSFRTIPDAVLPYLKRLDLSHPDWALFGKNYGDGENFKPAPKPADQRKFAGYWSGWIRPALGFPTELQLYRDTGITNMATAGVAINLVQQQADHSNVAITSIYLGRKPEADAKIKQADILPK